MTDEEIEKLLNHREKLLRNSVIDFLKIDELEKQLDCYKALESHYEEIEEDAKAITEENEQLKAQIKDLCESLDIMNNRESELLEQIEKMKCYENCKYNNYSCGCENPDECNNNSKWELAE